MLSIFDTDGGFLDDLASDNGMASSGNLMDAGGMLGQYQYTDESYNEYTATDV